MKHSLAILAALIMDSFSALHGAELALTSPLDYQVIQRSSFDEGTIRIVGQLSEVPPQNAVIEALVIDGKTEAVWQKLQPNIAGQSVDEASWTIWISCGAVASRGERCQSIRFIANIVRRTLQALFDIADSRIAA